MIAKLQPIHRRMLKLLNADTFYLNADTSRPLDADTLLLVVAHDLCSVVYRNKGNYPNCTQSLATSLSCGMGKSLPSFLIS